MKKTASLMIIAALGLSACETTDIAGSGAATQSYIQELPESITAMAAPNQDLTAVQVDPVDNCFVYRHVGPVETTMLPLRTKEGRPICAKPATS